MRLSTRRGEELFQTVEVVPKKRSIFALGRRHFARARHLTPDSAKTYGNPARGIVCRNTDDFPVRTGASLIGPLMALPEIV